MGPGETETFDAEFHLRRHLEDEFGVDYDEHLARHRARALVVLDLLPLERARAILQVYNRAGGIRQRGVFHDEPDDEADDAEVGQVRVVLLDQAVEAPFGTVHLRHATFGPRGTRLAAKIDFGRSGPTGGFRHHMIELDVVDDQGTSTRMGFGGGGGNRVWRGHFDGGGALSPTTAWLDVHGQRVELVERPSSSTVRVHDVREDTGPALDARAAHFLRWCLLHQERHGDGSATSAVLDTLVASGSLTADSPTVIGARAVRDARAGQVGDPATLPEPWRSALTPAPRKVKGPKGDIAVSAATPVFDGVRLTVFLLSSRRGQFTVELEGHGTGSDRLTGGDREMTPVTFTAVDDLGNHYLGSVGEFHSGGTDFGGTVAYEPTLDPAATTIELEFSTPRARAVVEVPLRWERRP